MRVPDRPVQLVGDRTRLAQVLSNLLNNSAKYTDRGGRVSLTVAQDGASVVAQVCDTGIGISPADLPRVFDLFTQIVNLGYETAELVSSDFKGDARSSIVDSTLTKVIGQSVKVISWYDNEWGYSNRVRDLILFLAKKGL